MTGRPRNLDLAAVGDILRFLREAEVQATVIGGIAVGAYAMHAGVTELSADLDVFVTRADQAILTQAVRRSPDAHIVKRPRPRSLSTLVFEWRGVEVDALVSSSGPLPPAEAAYEQAWRIGEAAVLDPYDLLANKLALGREKDRPHVEALLRFARQRVQHIFVDAERTPRKRADPARKLLKAIGQTVLPPDLFEQMVQDTIGAADRRFLANHAPTTEAAELLLLHAPEEEHQSLRRIAGAAARQE